MKNRLFTGLVGGSLFLASAVPVLAVDVYVIGNGKGSTNEVTVVSSCTQTVSQSSETSAEVQLYVAGNSGYNNASGNTGADVKIKTGDVVNKVDVGIYGGGNFAKVPDCCCGGESEGAVKIKENGKNSENTVEVTAESVSETEQDSQTGAGIAGEILGNSGENKAKYNTGKYADIKVKTGKVKNKVSVKVKGGSNVLF